MHTQVRGIFEVRVTVRVDVLILLVFLLSCRFQD